MLDSATFWYEVLAFVVVVAVVVVAYARRRSQRRQAQKQPEGVGVPPPARSFLGIKRKTANQPEPNPVETALCRPLCQLTERVKLLEQTLSPAPASPKNLPTKPRARKRKKAKAGAGASPKAKAEAKKRLLQNLGVGED